MIIEKMNYLRGGFDINVEKKMDTACGVIYRRSTPKPFKFTEMQVGP
jgi:hypothetical protein